MSTASFVYVLVNSAHSRLKIGKADDVRVRAAAFTRDAFDLESSFALRTDSARRAREVESILHLAFKRHRLAPSAVLADEGSSDGVTEWFDIAALAALRRFVKQNVKLVGYTVVNSQSLMKAVDDQAGPARPPRNSGRPELLPLYCLHELAYRTQYAELKERARTTELMLPGTPGTFREHIIQGRTYLYRLFSSVPGTPVDAMVARKSGLTPAALEELQNQLAFAQWMSRATADLRRLQFQVFDKYAARALVEWHNRGLLSRELVIAGSAAYRIWLNEFGARVIPRDAGQGKTNEVLTHLDFLAPLEALNAKVTPALELQVHRSANGTVCNTVKLPGLQVLPVRVLVQGSDFGKPTRVPSRRWFAVTHPDVDYLTVDPSAAAALAGGHCVPLRIPSAERLVWHMFHTSTELGRTSTERGRALLQAATLAAVLVEQDDADLGSSWAAAPSSLRDAVGKLIPDLRTALSAHPQTLEHLEKVLGSNR